MYSAQTVFLFEKSFRFIHFVAEERFTNVEMGGKSFMIGHGYIWVTVEFTSSCVISKTFE